MKKSEIYKRAMKAVVTSQALTVDEKLDILRELMDKERIEEHWEKEAEKGNTNEAV
jgi:hypothetical protein